jgi:hypothetical protein
MDRAENGRRACWGLAIWQLVNFSHKVSEAIRQRLTGIVPIPQPSPDFREDLRPVRGIFARIYDIIPTHGFPPALVYY